MSRASEKTLWLVGMPLGEAGEISVASAARIAQADIVIGESRKTALATLARVPEGRGKRLYLLDESARPEEKDWRSAVEAVAREGGQIALFSDAGMPLLFDPGREVLAECLRRGFRVRSCSSPTSWGSACALSGWEAPFLLLGFPPREDAPRRDFFDGLRQRSEHCVIMERPYRLGALLSELQKTFGAKRPAFLAWELECEQERLIWGSLSEIESEFKRFEKSKGEFVLILKGAPSTRKENYS